MDRFDLRSIGKFSTITNMQLVCGYVHILYPECERLSHANRRFIEYPYQKAITLVEASIQELLNLIFGDGLGTLPFRFWLFEDIFLDERSFRNMMQKRFVPPGASRKKRRRLVLHVGNDFFRAPMVVVKAPDDSQRMIDSSIGTNLGN